MEEKKNFLFYKRRKRLICFTVREEIKSEQAMRYETVCWQSHIAESNSRVAHTLYIYFCDMSYSLDGYIIK